MPPLAPSQCRHALARTPSPMAPSIWISDRMLFDAFQRYSLSSVRSTGADARCVHFNAGPLEHRRRAGKRRMTAVLPISRLEIPAWFLPLAQDNSPLAWAPPTKPSERHQHPGLLHGLSNRLIAWLEDYPPDEPFITPPTDETSANVTAATKATASSPATAEPFDVMTAMALLQDELRATPKEWHACRAVLNKHHAAAISALSDLALFQTGNSSLDDRERTHLRFLIDPFPALEVMFTGSLALTARLMTHWQARTACFLNQIAHEQPHLPCTAIFTEISKVLCRPRLVQIAEGGPQSSVLFHHWCSSMKHLSLAKESLQPHQQNELIEAMARILASKKVNSEDGILNTRLGWAMILLWRAKADKWKSAFDDIYSEFTTAEQDPYRDERTFYLILSEICFSRSLTSQEFASIFAYSHTASRWSALYATLTNQGVRAPRLLQKTNALLKRMNYTDEVATAIRAEKNPSLHRCLNGLAIATGDYQATLQKYNEAASNSCQSGNKQPWSYLTWCLHMNAMIQDPKIQITETTALFRSLTERATVNGVSAASLRRRGKARLLEKMSHTLACETTHFRPWRIWKELQVWNQLYRRLTGQYSLKISLIMMDITIARLRRGELISTRRLKLMANVVRVQAGEEQAQVFSERITRWRDQNKALGTMEQKFPLRSRRDQPARRNEQEVQMRKEQQPAELNRETAHSKDACGEIIETLRSPGNLQEPTRKSVRGRRNVSGAHLMSAEVLLS